MHKEEEELYKPVSMMPKQQFYFLEAKKKKWKASPTYIEQLILKLGDLCNKLHFKLSNKLHFKLSINVDFSKVTCSANFKLLNVHRLLLLIKNPFFKFKNNKVIMSD